MPKVTTRGGVKNFPYTKKGKQSAKKYAQSSDGVLKRK